MNIHKLVHDGTLLATNEVSEILINCGVGFQITGYEQNKNYPDVIRISVYDKRSARELVEDVANGLENEISRLQGVLKEIKALL